MTSPSGLPPLHALSATPTGAPLVGDLGYEERKLITEILTADGQPQKVCRYWSQWCDLKSGDGECVDLGDGKNPNDHEHWRRGCILLGVNPAFKSASEMPVPLWVQDSNHLAMLQPHGFSSNWRGLFNQLCNVLYELYSASAASSMAPSQHSSWNKAHETWAWYLLWLRERLVVFDDLRKTTGTLSGWFKVCANRVLKNTGGKYNLRILMSTLEGYETNPGDFHDFVKAIPAGMFNYNTVTHMLMTDIISEAEAETMLQVCLSQGLNPRPLWFTMLRLDREGQSRISSVRINTLIQVLLKHSAIAPDLTLKARSNRQFDNLGSIRLEDSSDGVDRGEANTMLVLVVTRGALKPDHPNHETEGRANLSAATALLEAGANPNVLRIDGQQESHLLHWVVEESAVGYARPDIVEVLLKFGANSEIADGRYKEDLTRPLVTAIDSSLMVLVQLLIGHGARVHDEDIVLAIRMGNFEIAQVLGAAGPLWRLPEKLRQAVEAAETLRQLLKGYGEVRGFGP